MLPDRIIIRGPLQEVQKIKRIDLEAVDLTDLSESKRLELRVEAPAENTSTNVNLVGVDIQISKVEMTEEIKNIDSDLSGQVVVPSIGKTPNKQVVKTKN